jgi:hypothetical protein
VLGALPSIKWSVHLLVRRRSHWSGNKDPADLRLRMEVVKELNIRRSSTVAPIYKEVRL